MSSHLPQGVAAEVTFRLDGVEAVLRIPEPQDPFAVCNAARERIFPDVEIPARDPAFEAVMAARKARKG